MEENQTCLLDAVDSLEDSFSYYETVMQGDGPPMTPNQKAKRLQDLKESYARVMAKRSKEKENS